MIQPSHSRFLLLSVLLAVWPVQQARALLNLDGTRNQIFVFGSVTFSHSSNIFYDATNRGDYSVTGEVGADLKRQAGIIAVNATVKFDYQRFDKYTGESAFDPNFMIEFVKSAGRVTGSFSASAYRESRADTAVNLRTNSWNVPLALNLKYPLNDKFYVSSQTGYLARRYEDNPVLTNYSDYSEGLDLFYVYTSKLDLSGGYRIRVSTTTTGRQTYDHWFNVGASGALFAKINGQVKVGYQIRDIDGGDSFNQANALASLTWLATRQVSVSGQVSRDFNTIATGDSVDSTSTALRVHYILNRKTDLDSGLGYGRNLFLGAVPQRRDEFFSWDIAAHYKLNEHLQLGATYSFLHNNSNTAFANFERNAFSLEISSRY